MDFLVRARGGERRLEQLFCIRCSGCTACVYICGIEKL